ncbi:YkvA family protein [Pseudomonas sp. DC3000-4b1]|uniref:YkvA family protein n=1 Tax=unclassified Pseudomonas TaxID=196821 RepID=UPI003CF35F00
MKAPFGFTRFLPLAERLVARGRLPALAIAVTRKMRGKRLGQVKEDIALLQALCLAYWRGEYRAVSTKAVFSIVAGLLYFVSPIDAVPDWLLGVGMLDDIAVLGFVMRVVQAELEHFRAWRSRQTPEALNVAERVPEQVAPLEGEYLGRS